MKKTKGSLFATPFTMVILMFAVGGTLIIIILTIVNMGTSVKILEGNINKLNGIDATHIISYCLKDGNDAILTEFLDENKGKNVCEVCGICETVIEFKVEDLETPETWEFDYSSIRQAWGWLVDKVQFWEDKSHIDNKILVSLRTEDGEVHIGKLYVWT